MIPIRGIGDVHDCTDAAGSSSWVLRPGGAAGRDAASAGMAVIAVYSCKGGVGKTTLAVDLAWRCAVQGGASTLLWDLDMQGGAGILLDVGAPERPRVVSLFEREGRPTQHVAATRWPGLSLLSADESLGALPVHLARVGQRRRLANLTVQMSTRFERIVLDCPPVQNELSDQILAAADVVIVPLPPSPLSARALERVRRDLARAGGRHPPLLPVLAMYDGRRKAHKAARTGAMAAYPVIPWSSDIEQVAFRNAPIGTFANSSDGGRALERVWRAVEFKLREMSAARCA